MRPRLNVYSDGASRGNPGPSAIAFIVVTEDGRTVKRHTGYCGIKTNNQAEYEALISALESVAGLTDEVTCFLDSELVVKHLNGEYTVRDPQLRVLWLRVNELRHAFSEVSFVHVSRTDGYVQEVDRMANQALDKNIA